jgi:hypothetical protein
MELEASEFYLKQSGFKIIDHFYRPSGKPRDQQPWLAIVSQRQDLKT